MQHSTHSLFYRYYIKANFNVRLFVGLLVSFIKLVLYHCYFCCTQTNKTFLQLWHLGTFISY